MFIGLSWVRCKELLIISCLGSKGRWNTILSERPMYPLGSNQKAHLLWPDFAPSKVALFQESFYAQPYFAPLRRLCQLFFRQSLLGIVPTRTWTRNRHGCGPRAAALARLETLRQPPAALPVRGDPPDAPDRLQWPSPAPPPGWLKAWP